MINRIVLIFSLAAISLVGLPGVAGAAPSTLCPALKAESAAKRAQADRQQSQVKLVAKQAKLRSKRLGPLSRDLSVAESQFSNDSFTLAQSRSEYNNAMNDYQLYDAIIIEAYVAYYAAAAEGDTAEMAVQAAIMNENILLRAAADTAKNRLLPQKEASEAALARSRAVRLSVRARIATTMREVDYLNKRATVLMKASVKLQTEAFQLRFKLRANDC